MPIGATTLRPGLLVSLRTSIRGNVSYLKQVIEAEHLTDAGAQRAKWEMERLVEDPKEHEEAGRVRTKASYLIRSICTDSAFGLLCPEDKGSQLDRAMAEARALAEEFNRTAKLSRISINVITGRIASDDVEAVKAINAEVRDLMEQMAEGVARMDVKRIRDAASEAKSLGQMLSPDAQARIQLAIDAARATASQIKRAGEQAAIEVDRATIARITEARTAFLDMDDAREVAAPVAESRAVDFEPLTDAAQTLPVAAMAPAAPDLDWMRD